MRLEENTRVLAHVYTYIFSWECLSSRFAVKLRAALKGKLNCVHCAIYKCWGSFSGMMEDVVGV